MAVTISIKDHPETQQLLFADDDPLYWFLHPYFEDIFREVGRMVDLYDNAEFFAEELTAFVRVLENAGRDVRSRDDQWNVIIGYRGEDLMPIEKMLTKADAIDRIEALKELLNHAYAINRRVVCLGD